MRLSIAIPAWEYNGQGVELLARSFIKIEKQNFKDFEVVLSDHSKDDEIKNFCKNWEKRIKIKYIRNKNKRGSSSANINNAIKNCSGEIIKILCQDDYLYNRFSLEETIKAFKKDTEWLVSAYYHTKDKINIFNLHVPCLSSFLYKQNTIGTHSCLSIRNEDPILFDENLLWFMDCEYYYRLLLKYGKPKILKTPTVIQLLWEGQVTNTLVTESLIRKELRYVNEKHGL